MIDWVVDASVIAKWILAESDSADALRIISDTAARSGTLFVLDFALVEVANVIWVRHHRGLLTSSEAQTARGLLGSAAVSRASAMHLLDAAFDIAVAYDVAVYDALFVAATRSLKIGGVTADRPLVQAVKPDFPEVILLEDWT